MSEDLKPSGFTPGPWYVDEAGICSAERMVGMVCLSDVYFGSHEDDVPEAEQAILAANARLIAAAPDLVDGCNALLGLCELLLNRTDLPWEVREAISKSHRVGEARSAIAKATGQ